MYYWLFYYILNGEQQEAKFPLNLFTISEAFKVVDDLSLHTGHFIYIGMVNEKGVKVR